MRNLINKLMLLESVSKAKIAKGFEISKRGTLLFSYNTAVDYNITLRGKDEYKIKTFCFANYDLKVDKNGNLALGSSNLFNFFVLPALIVPALLHTIDAGDLEQICIKMNEIAKQQCGITSDVLDAQKEGTLHHYTDNDSFCIIQLKASNSEKLLEVINDAYQWRRETIGDLP